MDLKENPNQVVFAVGFIGCSDTLKMVPSVGSIGRSGLFPAHWSGDSAILSTDVGLISRVGPVLVSVGSIYLSGSSSVS